MLKEMTNKYGIDKNIEFTGLLSRKEIFKLMKKSKIFVHPSKFEGSGFVFAEALANGMNIVSFNVGYAQQSSKWFIAKDENDFISITNKLLSGNLNFEPLNIFPISETIKKYNKLYNRAKKLMITNKLKSINKRFYPQKLFYGPEWIVLGVNNVCNLHCKMCDVGIEYTASNFYQNLMGTSPLNMPIELIKKIFDETAKHFPKTKIGYAFTEPLIYPHLIESLHYAKEKILYTSITTNALTLKQKAKDLCDAGLNDIFISLDGPEEIHNEIRGNKNSFQKAIEGIEELLKQKNVPDISIFCVITEWNIGHLKEFVDYFIKFPIKQLGFMHTNFTPDFIVQNHNQIIRR